MNAQAEFAVLGACMLDPKAYWLVAAIVTEEDFTDSRNRVLWTAIGERSKAGSAVDAVTIGDWIAAQKLTHKVPAGYAMEVTNAVHSSRNAEGYARALREATIARKVTQAGQQIAALAGTGPDRLIEAQQILHAIAERSPAQLAHVRDGLTEMVKDMQRRFDGGAAISGTPSGLADVDALTNGWQGGDLIVVAARPKMGKSTFASQCAVHAAQQGKAAAFFSLEMSGLVCRYRMASQMSGVPMASILKPTELESEEWAKFTNATSDMRDLPLWLTERPRLSIEEISAESRKLHAREPLGIIVVDYLQIMRVPDADRQDLAIGEITGQLKALAKELNVPVMLLSQLNRKLESRENKRPNPGDLRESGSIEQDCDVLIFLYRDEVYHPETTNAKGICELIVALNRNGPTKTIPLVAQLERMRFANYVGEWPLPTTQQEHRPQQRSRGFNGAHQPRISRRDAAAGES